MTGRIERTVESAGLGYVCVDDRTYPFIFSQIDGYGGERLSELRSFSQSGIRIGTMVNVELDEAKEVVVKIFPARDEILGINT
jgi:hypothetical protein